MWDRARQKLPMKYAAQRHGRLDFDEITFHVSRDHSIGYETANSGGVNDRFYVYVLIHIKFALSILIVLASATVVIYFIQNLITLNVQLRTKGRARNPMKSQTSHDSTRDGIRSPCVCDVMGMFIWFRRQIKNALFRLENVPTFYFRPG
jgi:hypothetical protein